MSPTYTNRLRIFRRNSLLLVLLIFSDDSNCAAKVSRMERMVVWITGIGQERLSSGTFDLKEPGQGVIKVMLSCDCTLESTAEFYKRPIARCLPEGFWFRDRRCSLSMKVSVRSDSSDSNIQPKKQTAVLRWASSSMI